MLFLQFFRKAGFVNDGYNESLAFDRGRKIFSENAKVIALSKVLESVCFLDDGWIFIGDR